jgi:hypothetical protein
MNQIMVNAVEFDQLLRDNQTLKARVAELEKCLADERQYVELLKHEVGFAENGYTQKPWQDLTNDEILAVAGETLDVWACATAVQAKLKEKNAKGGKN